MRVFGKEVGLDNPIFLVGLPRSGSTFWLNLIATDPKICKMGEMFFLAPFWRKDVRYFMKTAAGDLMKEENVRKMIDVMFSGKRVPGLTASFWQYYIHDYETAVLKDSMCRRILASDRSIESLFKAIVQEIPDYLGFSRCCVKFPVSVDHVPELFEWFPNGRVVHMVRDPRAMVVSRVNFAGHRRLKNGSLISLFSIMQYIWTSRLHEQLKRNENYALFRYEDLLDQPEKTIGRLCEFARIDFTPQMLAPGGGQPSSVTGEIRTGFNKEAASHWKSMISPWEAILITLLTRGSMKRFGYDPKNEPTYRNVERALP